MTRRVTQGDESRVAALPHGRAFRVWFTQGPKRSAAGKWEAFNRALREFGEAVGEDLR
jgi:hypothetical protein